MNPSPQMPRAAPGWNPRAQLADVLAWAVGHQIGLGNALRTLPSVQPPTRWKGAFARRLLRAIRDLEKGAPLHDALNRHLGRYLPAFYLRGIADAEADGRLDTALPALAEQMRFRAATYADQTRILIYPLTQAVVTLTMLLFLTLFMIPRFAEIFAEFSPPPSIAMLSVPAVTTIRAIVIGLMVSLGVIRVFLSPPGFAENLADRLPLLGRYRQCFLRLDAARRIHAQLVAGDDIVTAARAARRTAGRAWIRLRLDGFIQAMQAGRSWAIAWEEARLGGDLERWAVRNGAAREDPVSAFAMMTAWNQDCIQRIVQRTVRWSEPLGQLLLGGIVAWIVITLFATLVAITQSLL